MLHGGDWLSCASDSRWWWWWWSGRCRRLLRCDTYAESPFCVDTAYSSSSQSALPPPVRTSLRLFPCSDLLLATVLKTVPCTRFLPRLQGSSVVVTTLSRQLASHREQDLLSSLFVRCFAARGTKLFVSVTKMASYERQDSYGFGWADQDDKHFDEDVQGTQGRRKGSKMAKVKEAATYSVEKTMVAATAGAQIVKSGTSSSFRWIKEKVHRKN